MFVVHRDLVAQTGKGLEINRRIKIGTNKLVLEGRDKIALKLSLLLILRIIALTGQTHKGVLKNREIVARLYL